MPTFTVESTYHLPVYRHRTYVAATRAEACRQAIEDDDWSAEKRDYEMAGETYISGIWSGADSAYRTESLAVPSQFHETTQREASHFQELFDLLAYVAQPMGLSRVDFGRWLPKGSCRSRKGKGYHRGTPRS